MGEILKSTTDKISLIRYLINQIQYIGSSNNIYTGV